MSTIILGIESSCDDTSASVFRNDVILSNVVANQKVHEEYGGVVPELAVITSYSIHYTKLYDHNFAGAFTRYHKLNGIGVYHG